MKTNHFLFAIFFFGTILFPKETIAQEINEPPTDDLGNVSDDFQENFFEALKQKGIENYELAIEALRKAEKAAGDNPENLSVVYFEMGKNQVHLKQYAEAEENFKKVLQKEGDRVVVIEALYDLYYQKNDYAAAIPIVQQLIPFDDDYKEDLANLYAKTQQFDKSLALLDELDEIWGESDIRDALRSQIYRATGNASGAIEQLEERIDSNPKSEKEYLNLIYLYSDQGNAEKAFETAKTLLENNPNSELVHLALYKFYLDKGNSQQAMASMKKVFSSTQIDNESKHRVLADFIQFVNAHPEFEKELETVVEGFSEENNSKVYELLGNYYVEKNRKDEALKYYEKGIVNDSDNFNLIKNTLLLQIDFKKFDAAAKLSSEALGIFPAQPLLYLLNGVSNIGLQKPDVAIENLEMGLDFLLDDPNMERDFYEQLSLAFSQKGDQKTAADFAKKASEIKAVN